MPISITCSGCDKKLKVPETAMGKKIRCPACKNVIDVPDEDEDIVEPDEEVAVTKAVPPPIPRKAAWDDEPRSKKKRRADDDEYEKEEEDEDDEEEERRRRKKKRRMEEDEYDSPRRSRAPHRGVLILILGMLAILFSCAPIVAWVIASYAVNMANEDLTKMNKRRMDADGRGMTVAGKACGIVGSVLAGIWLIVAITLKVLNK